MIIEDLKIEWYARDIIRLIQDMRKEADYSVIDHIALSIWKSELIKNQSSIIFSKNSVPLYA